MAICQAGGSKSLRRRQASTDSGEGSRPGRREENLKEGEHVAAEDDDSQGSAATACQKRTEP